ILIKELGHFRKKTQALLKKESSIEKVLREGRDKAHAIANTTMQEAAKNIGLLSI
ncbi:hypothetical protein IIB49_01440, partial [Patescibacteria group bacterium]|nr:hypothetical protein [Patescibacteria group bacterium]